MSQTTRSSRAAHRSPALRYPAAIIASAIIFVAIAGASAMTLRSPQYSAEARLMVGRINVSPQAVPAVVEASRQLASSYARVAQTSVVAALVKQRQAADGKTPTGSYAASPLPDSPIIRIKTTADSEADAVLLAQQVTAALEQYVRQVNDPSSDLDALLQAHMAASMRVADANRKLEGLKANPGAPIEELNAVEAELASARLRAEALSGQYQSRLGQAQGTGNVQVIVPAIGGGSDTREILQLWVASAAVAGVCVGLVLSSAIARRKDQRRGNKDSQTRAQATSSSVLDLDDSARVTAGN